MRIDVKPLTVNQAWQGRRFKTPKYKAYEKECLYRLVNFDFPDGEFQLDIEFGASNWRSDVDNVVKPFLDILQKRYGFDDSQITRLTVEKVKVEKGEEYIQFQVA